MDFFIDDSFESFKRLRTVKAFSPGDVVIDLSGSEEQAEPDYMSIDLGGIHIYHPVGRYINHSCDPNCYVDQDRKVIFARGTIAPNDEVTFNYMETERKIVAPFDCSCASDKCQVRIEK
ncbi:SET domain-containing protein-lysine N-methyltransferase [Amphritea sp. HPY]|uniref:SET domain-containing protein-lysine N-methyltransferase n=1 Tax=Amphritea sp. HPY TaxID=3421652 RepID=UPI003D7E3E4C